MRWTPTSVNCHCGEALAILVMPVADSPLLDVADHGDDIFETVYNAVCDKFGVCLDIHQRNMFSLNGRLLVCDFGDVNSVRWNFGDGQPARFTQEGEEPSCVSLAQMRPTPWLFSAPRLTRCPTFSVATYCFLAPHLVLCGFACVGQKGGIGRGDCNAIEARKLENGTNSCRG